MSASYDETVVPDFLEKMHALLARPKFTFSDASSAEIPQTGGVYVIHDKKANRILYVGRTGNLRRRLLGDHKSGDAQGSQFRRALGQELSLNSETEVTKYILKNCSFQFMPIEKPEEMVRLEHFVTAVLAPLFNVRAKR